MAGASWSKSKQNHMTVKRDKRSDWEGSGASPGTQFREARPNKIITYTNMADAMAKLPKCPRPKGGQLDHWWYIDHERLSRTEGIPCVCGACGQKINLSADSNPEEWPSV